MSEPKTKGDLVDLLDFVKDHIGNARRLLGPSMKESEVAEVHAELLRAHWRLGQAVNASMWLQYIKA